MRFSRILCAALCLFSALLAAQTVGPISITSNQCASIGVSPTTAVVGIQVIGTWTGTLQPKGTIQGQTAFNVQVTPSSTTTPQTTITANGAFYVLVAGYSSFQLCGATVGSGTAKVYLNAGNAPAGGGAGAPSAPATLPTSGLLAEYRMTEGAGTTLTDSSGQNNTATFCGSAPTWIAGTNISTGTGSQMITTPATGGLSFNGSSNCVVLPSPLNAGRTFAMFINFQPLMGASANFAAPLVGNGGGTGSTGILISNSQTSQCVIETFQTGLTVKSQARPCWQGQGFLAFTQDTVDHIFINASEVYMYGIQAATAGLQTLGTYQLGGTSQASSGSFFNGNIYWFAAWNRVLTLAELGQAYQYAAALMLQRGAPVRMGSTATANLLFADGDSITNGNGFTPYTNFMPALLNSGSAWNVINEGIGGAQISPSSTVVSLGSDLQTMPTYFGNLAGSNVDVIWAGSNDIGNGVSVTKAFGALRDYALRAHAAGAKVIVVTMLSRSAADAGKNTYDTLLRQQWPLFADALADVSANPLYGADGAFADTNIFNSGLHPVSLAHQYIDAPIIARAVNRLFGNTNFTLANTYASATAAGTTITAATDAANVATFTFTSNPFVQYQQLSITGVTPAGYNQPCIVQTATATQITCWNTNTSLGAGSVFGTAQAPSQVDADQYMILNFGAGNFLLQSCIGYTGQNLYIKNINAVSSTVVPHSSETIDGATTATVAQNATLVLQSVLVSSAAAGCNWKRIQNN